MAPVFKDTGTDDKLDSDIDISGISGNILIDTSKPLDNLLRNNTTIDAGLGGTLVYGSIGNNVWIDADSDGIYDSSELPLVGLTVYLYDATGTTILDSTITDANGKFLFDSLLTGDYRIRFTIPEGTAASKSNVGSDETDSDANSIGWSQIVNIDTSKPSTDTLRNNLTIGAGFVQVGVIGDYVFLDKDGSGTQSIGDIPLSGLRVYLLDATTGAKIDSTITDANGLYIFDELNSGSYKIQVVYTSNLTPVSSNFGSDDTIDSDIDSAGISGVIIIDTTKPVENQLRINRTVDAGLKPSEDECKPSICVPIVIKKTKSRK